MTAPTQLAPGVAIVFTVPGPPRSKARTRTKGRQFFTDPVTRAHEKHVAQRAMLAARTAKWEKTAGPVAVTIRLFYSTKNRRDIDRAINAALDGVTQSAAVWNDDSQVDQVTAQRWYEPGNPRTEIAIERLPSGYGTPSLNGLERAAK